MSTTAALTVVPAVRFILMQPFLFAVVAIVIAYTGKRKKKGLSVDMVKFSVYLGDIYVVLFFFLEKVSTFKTSYAFSNISCFFLFFGFFFVLAILRDRTKERRVRE